MDSKISQRRRRAVKKRITYTRGSRRLRCGRGPVDDGWAWNEHKKKLYNSSANAVQVSSTPKRSSWWRRGAGRSLTFPQWCAGFPPPCWRRRVRVSCKHWAAPLQDSPCRHEQLFSTLLEPLTVIRGTDLSFCLCQTDICGADRGGRAVGPPLRSVLYRTSWRACSSLRRLWMRINVLRGKQDTRDIPESWHTGLIEMGEGKLKDKISESLFQFHHITSKPCETKFLGCNVPSSACLQGLFVFFAESPRKTPSSSRPSNWNLTLKRPYRGSSR